MRMATVNYFHRLHTRRLFRNQLWKSTTLRSKVRPISTSNVYTAEDKPAGPIKDDKRTDPVVKSTEVGELVDPQAIQKPKFRGPLQRMKDSHEQTVRESGGLIIVPNNLDKVALLWSGKYATPEEIPPMISAKVQARADDKMRVVMCIWMMSAITFAFLTMIKLGQRRIKWSHDKVTEKQNQIWAERARNGNTQLGDIKNLSR